MLREGKSYSPTLCHLVTDLQTMHILEVNIGRPSYRFALGSCLAAKECLPGPADLTLFAIFVYNILDHLTVIRPFLPSDLFLFIYFKVVRG